MAQRRDDDEDEAEVVDYDKPRGQLVRQPRREEEPQKEHKPDGPDPFASARLLQEIWDNVSPKLKEELATRLTAKLYERVNNTSELLNEFIDAKLREVMAQTQLTAELREDLTDRLRRALKGQIEQQVQNIVAGVVSSTASTIAQRVQSVLKGW